MQVEVKVTEDNGLVRYLFFKNACLDLERDTVETCPKNFYRTRKALDTGKILIWGNMENVHPEAERG